MFSRLVIIMSIGLSGCAFLEQDGTGGYEKNIFSQTLPVEYGYEVSSAHNLRMDSELTSRHLDILVLEGAKKCFPASVKQLRSREVRVQREIIAGLYGDATANIIVQRKKLAVLEQQLDWVRRHDSCILDDNYNLAEETQNDQTLDSSEQAIIDRLEHLLNADNMFAFDSPKVNPKFRGRIELASKLLTEHAAIHIEIIGHADKIGSDIYNIELSERRAVEVKNLFEYYGVSASRLSILARGESEPYSNNIAAEHRLVNRRVYFKFSMNAGE